MESFSLKGRLFLKNETGLLAYNIVDNWLVGLRETNPAILDMFCDRDKKPYRDLLPWSGEFAGKYITGAYYIYRVTNSEKLYNYITKFIDELIGCVDTDGYIGCYQKECRLTGAYSKNPKKTGETWDTWSHYHIMVGLMLWYELTGDERLFDTVKKIAGLFLNTFYNGKKRLVDIGWSEMNLAPLHIFALLYQKTKDERYLRFALEIEKDLESPEAGNYINHSLNGLEYFECPKPRWESLHVIMGIAEMYRCTGDEKYLNVAKQIFYSILKTDVHNTGGFSTDEQAIGNPFKNGNIELCCVVAYNALACEIFKLTGDLKIADFLELSLYNAVIGSYSPTGRWSTYNTPMEGIKYANFHSIGFQCRPGSPELNCCSVNAPRGVGMLSEWAFMQDGDTVYINYLERCSFETQDGLKIEIDGKYPANGLVQIRLESKNKQKIAIRIPEWSKKTEVKYGNKSIPAEAGQYIYLEKQWHNELLTIKLDFTPRLVEGGGELQGKKCIYIGPILYGFDLGLNNFDDIENSPSISVDEILTAIPEKQKNGR
ncbi:MAG: beta-L-arabinofuranosidase domain-containing protein, partial [Eubacteriales bacterium]